MKSQFRTPITAAEFVSQMQTPATDLLLAQVALEEMAREVYGDEKKWGLLRPSDRLLADLDTGFDGLALCDVVLSIERRLRRPIRIRAVPQGEMSLEAFITLLEDPLGQQ
jgi:hypothetical protein